MHVAPIFTVYVSALLYGAAENMRRRRGTADEGIQSAGPQSMAWKQSGAQVSMPAAALALEVVAAATVFRCRTRFG